MIESFSLFDSNEEVFRSTNFLLPAVILLPFVLVPYCILDYFLFSPLFSRLLPISSLPSLFSQSLPVFSNALWASWKINWRSKTNIKYFRSIFTKSTIRVFINTRFFRVRFDASQGSGSQFVIWEINTEVKEKVRKKKTKLIC